MKTLQFITFAILQGNNYAPAQVVAFGDDDLANTLLADGVAMQADQATVFVEHIDRTEPQP